MPYHPVWTLIDDNKRGRPRKENSSGKWAAKLAQTSAGSGGSTSEFQPEPVDVAHQPPPVPSSRLVLGGLGMSPGSAGAGARRGDVGLAATRAMTRTPSADATQSKPMRPSTATWEDATSRSSSTSCGWDQRLDGVFGRCDYEFW